MTARELFLPVIQQLSSQIEITETLQFMYFGSFQEMNCAIYCKTAKHKFDYLAYERRSFETPSHVTKTGSEK